MHAGAPASHILSEEIVTVGELEEKMATMAAENLLAGLRGQPLPNCVNPEVRG